MHTRMVSALMESMEWLDIYHNLLVNFLGLEQEEPILMKQPLR